MAKNRVKMNIDLFSRVIDALEHLKPGSKQALSGGRFIALSEDPANLDNERAYLGSISVERVFTDSHITWAKIDTAAGKRLVFSGPYLDLGTTFDVRAATACEFLFFSDYFSTHPVEGSGLIHEILDAGHMGLPGYNGHDYKQVGLIFQPVYVIESQSLLDNCTSRVITEIFIANGQSHRGNYNIDFYNRVRHCDWISCDFEQSKMLSAFYVYGPLHFLTLYWLLESFFFEFAAKALYLESRPSIPEDAFYLAIKNQLDWRPREIHAFERLVLNTASLEEMRNIAEYLIGGDAIQGAQGPQLAGLISKQIYKFRNSIVHTRHDEKKPSTELTKVHTCALYDIIEALFRTRSPSGESGCRCGICIAD